MPERDLSKPDKWVEEIEQPVAVKSQTKEKLPF